METWETIEGYGGIYEVSSLGNVKSFKFGREKFLKQIDNSCGYFQVFLFLNGNRKARTVHQLVAEAFLNHQPCGYKLVVNHKDFNKLNNKVENLEIVTQRENANLKHLKSSSKYVGVCWHKNLNKWHSYIVINGKKKHLGYFTTELEASNAYQKALSITNKKH